MNRKNTAAVLETQMLGTVTKVTNVYEISSTKVRSLFREISV